MLTLRNLRRLAVQVAALELNEACQDLRMAPGLGYAYTFIDAAGKMKVTLQAPARTQLGDAEVGAGTS